MRNPTAIVLAVAVSFAVGGLCSAQPAPELGESPLWSAPSDRLLRAVHATPTPLVLDRGVAFASLAAAQPQSASSNNNVLKWVGVGLMVVGGLWAIDAALCGSVAAANNVDVGGVCTGTLVAGAGVGGAGWFLFDRNR